MPPPVSPNEVVRLDDTLARIVQHKPIESLRAGGRTTVSVVSRDELLREVLRLVALFVEERIRQAEASLRDIVAAREGEAKKEGSLRVLSSLADLGDLLDSSKSELGTQEPSPVAVALDRKLDRIFRTFGFVRIATVGAAFDSARHEIVDELAVEGVARGMIVGEIGRGYEKDGFVLRVARVVVAA